VKNLIKHAGRTSAVIGIVGIVVVAATSLSHAQTRPIRRGAPRDWSHNRLVATRFGPDLDRAIDSDVRTYNKHLRRDLAKAAQAPEPVLDFFTALLKKLMPPPVAAEAGAHLDWFLNTGGYGPVVGDPAKYSFDIASANCADVIYYTVNQAGSATAANVIAITNPYSTCPGNAGGTTPTVKFALRLTSGTATSAVPSLDGTVLYVLESRATSTLLHAINVANIIATPGTYDFTGNVWTSVHTLATAPIGTSTSEQLFQLTFATAVNNVSSPYLDYWGHQIFFGDAAGAIHRVINTDLATASEDLSNGFPVACGTSQLTSPVFINNQVIATSANGFAYRIDLGGATPYAAIRSTQGGTGVGAEGGLSSPVVDITNNQVIVTTGKAFVSPVKAIAAFPLMFAANAAQTSAQALGVNDGFASSIPAFDDAFWSTNNGFAYATGGPSGGGNTYLIKVPYNGTLSAPNGYAALKHTGGNLAVQTTAVAEFLTASASANKDFLFVGASGGTYLYVNRLLTGFAGTNAAPVGVAGFFAAPGGVSSGIVIDNRTSANITNGLSTANIYYGTKGVGPATTQSRIVQLNQEF
jgi:hypothetical protein